MMFTLFACFTSYTLRVRGQEGEDLHAVLCCCSCPLCACVCVGGGGGGAGANLNTVKRIVTLHWNQTIHLKKLSTEMNIKNHVLPVLIDSQARCTCG